MSSSSRTSWAHHMQVHILWMEIFHSFVQLTYTKHLLEAKHCEKDTEHTVEQKLG